MRFADCAFRLASWGLGVLFVDYGRVDESLGKAAGGWFSVNRFDMVVLSIYYYYSSLLALCFINSTVYVFEYIAGPGKARSGRTEARGSGAGAHSAAPPAA